MKPVLVPLPVAAARAVLRRDVVRGGAAACLLGLAGSALLAFLLPVPTTDGYGQYGTSELPQPLPWVEGWLALCASAAAFTIVNCATWLWLPIARLAQRIRLGSRARQLQAGDVELLVVAPAKKRTLQGFTVYFLVPAMLVDVLFGAAVLYAEEVKKTGALSLPWMMLWPLMLLAALLTLCAAVATLMEGAIRTFRYHWFIGGSGHVSMRRLLGRRARVREVRIPDGKRDLAVTTARGVHPLEVPGLSSEAEKEYAEWLQGRVDAELPGEYRLPPHGRKLLKDGQVEEAP